jgi:hypothetical protein
MKNIWIWQILIIFAVDDKFGVGIFHLAKINNLVVALNKQVNPLPVIPPRCLSGETITTDCPIRFACTAAVTAAEVPP